MGGGGQHDPLAFSGSAKLPESQQWDGQACINCSPLSVNRLV